MQAPSRTCWIYSYGLPHFGTPQVNKQSRKTPSDQSWQGLKKSEMMPKFKWQNLQHHVIFSGCDMIKMKLKEYV
jgi:hypothetical protein